MSSPANGSLRGSPPGVDGSTNFHGDSTVLRPAALRPRVQNRSLGVWPEREVCPPLGEGRDASLVTEVPSNPGGGRGREGLPQRRSKQPNSPVVLNDAVLLTSELAMNGVRHVPAAEGDWLEITVDQDVDALTVNVRSPGKNFASEDLSRTGEGRLGSALVGELSSRWGVVTPDSDGTAVWFRMDWSAAGPTE